MADSRRRDYSRPSSYDQPRSARARNLRSSSDRPSARASQPRQQASRRATREQEPSAKDRRSARRRADARAAASRPAARVGGLDGLRVLAIVAILVYHANATWLPGGFIGVTLFFVLSGFLITLSVTHELDRTGTLSYGRFLGRRVKRLWPMMLAVIGATVVLTFLLAQNLLGKVKTDALPAALFVENWFYILREQSYFAAAGSPSPLTHLWYVAVVMQFYVVWPLVLFAMDRMGLSRRAQAVVTTVLAVASAVAMGVLYDPHGDSTRVYYGLDTRAAELLVGAVCGLLFVGDPLDGVDEGSPLTDLPLPPDVFVVAGLALLGWFCVGVNGYTHFLYRGGFALSAVASGLVVLGVGSERSLIGRLLSLAPFAWLGARSYALYLWHYPLFIIMNPASRMANLPVWAWVGEFALVLVVSELVYELFDGSLARKGGPSASDGRAADGRGARTAVTRGGLRLTPSLVLDCAGVALIVVVTLIPMDLDAQTQGGATDGYEQATDGGASATTDTSDTPEQVERFNVDGTDFEGTPLVQAIDVINGFATRVDPETGAMQANVLLIGDSVSGGGIIEGQDYFDEYFPNGRADYAVGRQIYVGPDIYAQYAADFDWGYVVWCLGNNGYADEDEVRALIDCVGERPVYLVTVRESNGLTDHNNEVFRSVAAEYDNCQIIDWYAASEGHSEYFYDDGTHLRPAGGQAYMQLIRDSIAGS